METGIKQYLTFILQDEYFALPITKTREVVELTKITKIPRSEPFMVGFINLRGNVVPVVDLRIKFGLEKKEYDRNTSIIITEIEKAEESLVVGILVDEVKEVIDLGNSQMEIPPSLGMCVDRKFITAIGKRDNDFLIILDICRVLSESDVEILSASADTADKLVLKESG